MTEPNPLISAFVSYSHESEPHKARVADLATRLRTDGIDCELDQWVASPPEGWPNWMIKRITNSKFVIVVCTERYFKRVTGLDEERGLGSRWEGALITQELYETGGSNTKFVPVIFQAEDDKWRPPFLRGATYYDVSTATGYEQLYRHLTEQPVAVKPPLGKIRRLPNNVAPSVESPVSTPAPKRELPTLVLLFPLEGDFSPVTAPAHRVELASALVVELTPEDSTTSGILLGMRRQRGIHIGVAYGLTPVYGRVEEVKQIFVAAQERWVVTVSPSTDHIDGVFMEMSFGNRSADDIALLRARRILLNERVPEGRGGTVDELNATTLDVFVSGFNTPISVRQSPFPGLFKTLGQDRDYFVAVCRLFGVLFLYLTATVERVYTLDVELRQPDRLSVKFEGQRSRKFANVDPVVLKVEGDCHLGEGEAEV